ncbi:MAG: MORN repeat-containing protein, partial [Rhizomicrobium sp.]
DSIRWKGTCAVGMVWGTGMLTYLNNGRVIETIAGTFGDGALLPGHVSAAWPDGAKYDGGQVAGQFDGTGVFVSATGQRISTKWKAGTLNGKASFVWANGDRYDGDWKNGQPDGQGIEIWANGNRYDGLWKDGKPVGQPASAPASAAVANPGLPALADATVAPGVPNAAAVPPASPLVAAEPAAQPAQSAAVANAADAPAEATRVAGDPPMPLHDFIGKILVAVDGSTIGLDGTEGGFTRSVTLPSGVAQQTSFAFMNDRIGTVSSQSTTIGLFRRSGDEIDVDYSDGDVETMKPDGSGGLLQTANGADGGSSCTAWYPRGHVFSEDERRAAVQEYAARLGVAAPAAAKSHHATRSASQSCGGGFLMSLAGTGAVIPTSPDKHLPATSPTDTMAAQASVQIEKTDVIPNGASPGLQTVPVKASAVHLIDRPNDPTALQPSLQEAKYTTDTTPQIPPPPPDAAAPAASPNASACLSVTSNGEYWGFQNSCANAVQFAYCEMNDANPLTSCHRTSVSGSVAANGFSALIGDRSLAEQGVKHDFRWMACDGGAGEVVPHLDTVDPPVGRCLRAVPAANSGGAS